MEREMEQQILTLILGKKELVEFGKIGQLKMVLYKK
jgi:hypothetical protein